ncbi:MAG: hypothetical protein H0V07_12970 [Propionibacteriales bacterium]|nr:hypothetical protein [Propionibacteriales bacterium]
MSATLLTPVATPRRVRRLGAWCLAGGLLGAAEGVITLAWPHQVTEERFSYPFDAFWFVIAELSYAAQHLMLIAGALALLRLPIVSATRAARIATRVALAGLILLVVAELSALALYDAATDSALATVIASSFMLPVLLIGVGFTVAGVALIRQGAAGRAGVQWLPAAVLAPGIYVFTVFIPLINQSDFIARLGIGGWMLLFAVLGYGLTRLEDHDV